MGSTDPLYQQIKSHLKNLIAQNQHNPYYQFPSETQLAHTFKTSRSPIQKALSELKDEGLIYKVRGKGTFIYTHGRQARSLTIYLVIPHMTSHYMQSIIQGAHDYYRDKNVYLFITITDDNEKTEQEKIEYIMKQDFSGILFYPIITDTYHDALFKLLLNGCQVVVIGHYLPKLNFSSVHCDYYRQIYHLTEYLLKKGHQHIAFITESRKHNFVYRERIQGYWDCITQSLNSSYIHLLEIDVPAEDAESQRAHCAQFLKKNSGITAIIAMSKAAENVFELLETLGNRDVLVASIDEPENVDLAEHENVLLLDQMPYQIGWKAAEQLYNQILKGAPVNEIITADRIVEERLHRPK